MLLIPDARHKVKSKSNSHQLPLQSFEKLLTETDDLHSLITTHGAYTFYDSVKGKSKYYPDAICVDTELKKIVKVIEVKSPFTLLRDIEQNLAKKDAVMAAGYSFQMIIYERNQGYNNQGHEFDVYRAPLLEAEFMKDEPSIRQLLILYAQICTMYKSTLTEISKKTNITLEDTVAIRNVEMDIENSLASMKDKDRIASMKEEYLKKSSVLDTTADENVTMKDTPHRVSFVCVPSIV